VSYFSTNRTPRGNFTTGLSLAHISSQLPTLDFVHSSSKIASGTSKPELTHSRHEKIAEHLVSIKKIPGVKKAGLFLKKLRISPLPTSTLLQAKEFIISRVLYINRQSENFRFRRSVESLLRSYYNFLRFIKFSQC